MRGKNEPVVHCVVMILFTHIAWLHIRSVVTIVSRNCMVAYVHIHIHTHRHTHIHIQIHIHTHTHARTKTHTRVGVRTPVVETEGASTLVLPYEADRNFKVDIRVRSCCPEYRDRNAQFSIKLEGQADHV